MGRDDALEKFLSRIIFGGETNVPRNEPSPRQRGKAVLPLPESRRQPRKRASAEHRRGEAPRSTAAHAVLDDVRLDAPSGEAGRVFKGSSLR